MRILPHILVRQYSMCSHYYWDKYNRSWWCDSKMFMHKL